MKSSFACLLLLSIFVSASCIHKISVAPKQKANNLRLKQQTHFLPNSQKAKPASTNFLEVAANAANLNRKFKNFQFPVFNNSNSAKIAAANINKKMVSCPLCNDNKLNKTKMLQLNSKTEGDCEICNQFLQTDLNLNLHANAKEEDSGRNLANSMYLRAKNQAERSGTAVREEEALPSEML